jgi:hypothetical protein
MADQLQLRGGTTSEHATFTGALREVTVDTDKDTLVVHDNALAGGYPLLRQDLSNLPAGTIDNADINASAAIVDTKLDTIATAGKVSNSATTATNANTASAIVARDASGNFSAGTITAALTGAASSNVLKAGDTMTGALVVPLASEATPSLTFTGDLNTGIYSPGVDQVAVATNGTARLYIASDGKVGVGTTNPPNRLSVLQGEKINFCASSNGAAYGYITGDNSNNLAFGYDTTETARIDSSGRLLVGTSSARSDFFSTLSSKLQIEGTDSATAAASITRNSADASGAILTIAKTRGAAVGGTTIVNSNDTLGIIAFQGYDSTDFRPAAYLTAEVDGTPGANDMPGRIILSTTATGASSPTERMRIDSSGRLLVGTSSSSQVGSSLDAALQVESTSQAGSRFSILRRSSNNAGPVIALGKTGGSGSEVVLADDALGTIDFAGGDGADVVTSAARIKAEVDGTPGANDMPGRLVFSTTADAASSPTERMRINNGGQTSQFSETGWDNIRASSASAAGTSRSFYTGYYSATGVDTGTVSYRVRTNGNVQNTNNSYGAISDIKLKENIVDASSQWDDLKALQVRNYNFKEGQTHTQIGLVAQEVELVSPGLVSESPDHDEEGNDLGTVTKSVNYSVLYMKAVKALQEAIGRIETLEAEVAALKAQ